MFQNTNTIMAQSSTQTIVSIHGKKHGVGGIWRPIVPKNVKPERLGNVNVETVVKN